jgi:hypothetical protein
MLELDDNLNPLVTLMNEGFEKKLPDFPSFPKFTIWRMMCKIWMKEVIQTDGFGLSLIESFLRIINNFRESNIKPRSTNDFHKKELPKALINKLFTRYK